MQRTTSPELLRRIEQLEKVAREREEFIRRLLSKISSNAPTDLLFCAIEQDELSLVESIVESDSNFLNA
jgi:hypothetical protein